MAAENVKTPDATLQTQLRERDEELAEAQLHLAKMERLYEALEQQVSQQSTTLATQQAEIARLRTLLRECCPELPEVVAKPAMRDVVDQLRRHPIKAYATRRLQAITHICIHHSAVSGTVPVETVANYHVGDLDWPGIGYHFYVRPDGVVFQSQRMETVSWHVSNNNHYAVGVCLAGSFTQAPPPQLQVASVAHLVAWLMQELNVPEQHVLGYREFPRTDTSCPGETWLAGPAWKNMLLEAVRTVQAGVLG